MAFMLRRERRRRPSRTTPPTTPCHQTQTAKRGIGRTRRPTYGLADASSPVARGFDHWERGSVANVLN